MKYTEENLLKLFKDIYISTGVKANEFCVVLNESAYNSLKPEEKPGNQILQLNTSVGPVDILKGFKSQVVCRTETAFDAYASYKTQKREKKYIVINNTNRLISITSGESSVVTPPGHGVDSRKYPKLAEYITELNAQYKEKVKIEKQIAVIHAKYR